MQGYGRLMGEPGPRFTPFYSRLAAAGTVTQVLVQAGDTVFNRGTGEGWLLDGDI